LTHYTRLAKASHEKKLHPAARLEELLWDARQEFLSSGETPLDWDGLEREVALPPGRPGRGAMKQEFLFVAELYRYLVPFIDTDKPRYLSLDGIAARQGVPQGYFEDHDVPDLWFTLIGSRRPTLLEAKILNANRSVTVGQGQLSAWRSTGQGRHKPTAWVAADERLSDFYYWTHEAYLSRLDVCASTVSFPKIRMPDVRFQFTDVRQLALHVLRNV
jgi:hypothetical protein